MTKYFNAFYRHNGTSEILSLDEIAHHDNYDKLRKSLYCTGTGCHAQLRFYQQSNGHVYLSKYPSSEHANTCEFFTDSELYSRPQAEYIEQNGGLATSGIERRKREAQNALENYLSPQKKLAVGKHVAVTPKVKKDPKAPKQTIVKVQYDPNAPIINSENIRVEEPSFFQRFPKQLTTSDSNKNLRVSSRILAINLDDENKNCIIQTELDHVKVQFTLPESFFNSSTHKIIPEQLIEFLKILKKFIDASDTDIYLTTMCQSQHLNLNQLELFVLDYDFLSFQTNNGKNVYNDLARIAAAISTGALK
mgnify:CR=1 FL=1